MNTRKVFTLGVCLAFVTACTRVTPLPIHPATPSPQPTLTLTFTPQATETPTPSADQELLKEEWRIPIENAIVLFSACTFMFETLSDFQQGEIDLEAAQEELSLTADFIAMAEWFSPESYRGETSAAMMLDLELNMRALVEWYDTTGEEDISTQETLDMLFPICESAQALQTKVVVTAMDVGLSEESVDEIDRHLSESEMFSYYYDRLLNRD